uniref:NAC family transcription factor n=1 Tax=Melilotus albus TaxID=47082 RepID=A0A896W542_MELAB|nr:NAC family transcription factor [Melilotus albus]
MLNLLPPGYKFLPSDVELIECYLQPKIDGQPYFHDRIFDVDVYKNSPDNLSAMYKREGEDHTYFFTQRNRKYPRGNRPDRDVGGVGTWKATGKDHPIINNGTTIGFKKWLVYYIGKSKDGVKTNWIMQEFTINVDNIASSSTTSPSKLDNWVLCKIYENKREYASEDATKVKRRKNRNQEVEGMTTLEKGIPSQQIHSAMYPISLNPPPPPPPPMLNLEVSSDNEIILEDPFPTLSRPPPPPPTPFPPLNLEVSSDNDIVLEDLIPTLSLPPPPLNPEDPFGGQECDDIASFLNLLEQRYPTDLMFPMDFPSHQFPSNEPST